MFPLMVKQNAAEHAALIGVAGTLEHDADTSTNCLSQAKVSPPHATVLIRIAEAACRLITMFTNQPAVNASRLNLAFRLR